MDIEMPKVPEGTGASPVALVVISANDLAASSAFYATVFGWQVQKMSAELSAVATPAGPMVALRANVPAGFPGMVPYLRVDDVDATLKRIVAAGGMIERAPWKLPMMGSLARFKDPGGTIYGVTDMQVPGGIPKMPVPFGTAPKPPAGAICSLEMHAADGAVTARFLGDLFGWGTLPTMPQYVGFDAGAGVGGVLQSHTPASPAVPYIYSSDVAATLASVTAAGGKPMGEPMRMPGMACFGYFSDPSGAMIGLMGP